MSTSLTTSYGGVNASFTQQVDITPDDDVDLPPGVKAIFVGGDTGTINMEAINDGGTPHSNTYPTGMVIPGFIKRVHATGTTATGLTGWI